MSGKIHIDKENLLSKTVLLHEEIIEPSSSTKVKSISKLNTK